MLSLVAEDWEIVRDYWQETFIVFLAEMPFDLIVVTGCFGGIFGLYLLLTRRSRAINRRKQATISLRESGCATGKEHHEQ